MKRDSNPVIVKAYHGTDAKFKEFDLAFKGSNTGWDNCTHGIFFSDKINNAAMFGDRIIEAELTMRMSADLRLEEIFSNEKQASVLAEIIFGERLSNVKALERLNEEIGLGELGEMWDSLNTSDANELLKQHGYDSIISDMGDSNVEFIIFDTKQIQIISEFSMQQRQVAKRAVRRGLHT